MAGIDKNILFDLWLKSQKKAPVEQYEDYPAYSMPSEEIMKYMKAIEYGNPMPLFEESEGRPILGNWDYPTKAVNIKPTLPLKYREGVAGVPETMMFSEDMMMPYLMGNKDTTPEEMQGIYEHEYGHYKDQRPDPYKMWSFPNKGLITWQGLSGGLLQREFPAMVAEEAFWNKLKKGKLGSR